MYHPGFRPGEGLSTLGLVQGHTKLVAWLATNCFQRMILIQKLLGLMATTTSMVPYARLLQNWFLKVFRINIDPQSCTLPIPRGVICSVSFWSNEDNLSKGWTLDSMTLTFRSSPMPVSVQGWLEHVTPMGMHSSSIGQGGFLCMSPVPYPPQGDIKA